MTPGNIAKLQKAVALQAVLAGQTAKIIQEVSELETDLMAWEEALSFMQEIARKTQEKIRFQFEGVVNLAIKSIWEDNTEFSMEFTTEAGRTAVRLCLKIDGNEIDPLEDDGGGLGDVVAIALRIAALVVSRKRKLLVLDEALKFVSADLQDAACAMLYNVCKSLGIQVITSTHIDAMKEVAGTIYEIEKDGVISKARLVNKEESIEEETEQ